MIFVIFNSLQVIFVCFWSESLKIFLCLGTTGLPKAATLSHHNIVNNGYFAGLQMNFTPDENINLPCPLYHCMGCVLGVCASITHSTQMTFPAPTFDTLKVKKNFF